MTNRYILGDSTRPLDIYGEIITDTVNQLETSYVTLSS